MSAPVKEGYAARQMAGIAALRRVAWLQAAAPDRTQPMEAIE